MDDVQQTASNIVNTIRSGLLESQPGRPEPTVEEILAVIRSPEVDPDDEVTRAVGEYLATGKDPVVLFDAWVFDDDGMATKALVPPPDRA